MTTASHHPIDDQTASGLIGGDSAKTATPAIPGTTRWLALGAVAGPILFTLAWLVLGQLRPGYSFVSRPVSALGIGPNGVFMDAAFVLNGVLLIVGLTAVFQSLKHQLGALARWMCTALLLLSPLGVLWDGIFTMNTLALHTLGAEVALGTPVISFLIVGLVLRRVPEWKRFGTWMLVGCPLTLVLLVGFSMSVPPSELATGGGSLGLWQRALIIEVQAWFMIMGRLAFRGS
jgi:hypothetical membrane protein